MADQTVTININAVDNATSTMESVGDAFNKTQRGLIAFGNAARSVDNIMDTFQNTQMRIENAELRVIDSQEDLNKAITKYGKDSDEAEAASRRLTITQNNLARAQNTVLGSYIGIGIQTMTLIGSLPALIASLPAVAAGLYGMAGGFLAISIAGAPLWAILLAVIAAITAIYLAWKNWDKIINFFKETLASLMEKFPFLRVFFEQLKENIMFVINVVTTLIELFGKLIRKIKEWFKSSDKVTTGPSLKTEKPAFLGGGFGRTKTAGDFIMRPGQSPISFSPKDTLVGFKGGGGGVGGVTVNIQNVYGLNPRDVAIAMQRELNRLALT